MKAGWPALTHVNIDGNNVTKEGLSLLAKSHWPMLRELILCSATYPKQFHFNDMFRLIRASWGRMRHQIYCDKSNLLLNDSRAQALKLRLAISVVGPKQQIPGLAPGMID